MSAGSRHGQSGNWLLAAVVVIGAALVALASPAGPAARPAAPAAQPSPFGPDIVIMKELMDLYEPVPFDHKSHAMMAEMWEGCATCHHHQNLAKPGAAVNGDGKSEEIAACKSCHPIAGAGEDMAKPNLKGAYHRQCLNCHREWMHGNACNACHMPRDPKNPGKPVPTRDDIVGRMHPPIPEPDEVHYRARYEPAAGPNVLFRHKEHTKEFGLKCAHCHRGDSCANCHDPKRAGTKASRPLKPGMTWAESHGPCMNCHVGDRCSHCHFKDGGEAPRGFAHAMTGQLLDKDHVHLGCGKCHTDVAFTAPPTCGDSGCHKERVMVWPEDRPGPEPTTRPAVRLRGKAPVLPRPGVDRPGAGK